MKFAKSMASRLNNVGWGTGALRNTDTQAPPWDFFLKVSFSVGFQSDLSPVNENKQTKNKGWGVSAPSIAQGPRPTTSGGEDGCYSESLGDEDAASRREV